jgi:hypothetical protein
MLIIDENLHDQRIMAAISTWHPGQVISVVMLRPGTVIKDEAIPGLLLTATQPTFVTINAPDFWKKAQPHQAYCIVAVDLPKERAQQVPLLLRRLFRMTAFRTKALRMGKIIRLSQDRIEYYESAGHVQSLRWPD